MARQTSSGAEGSGVRVAAGTLAGPQDDDAATPLGTTPLGTTPEGSGDEGGPVNDSPGIDRSKLAKLGSRKQMGPSASRRVSRRSTKDEEKPSPEVDKTRRVRPDRRVPLAECSDSAKPSSARNAWKCFAMRCSIGGRTHAHARMHCPPSQGRVWGGARGEEAEKLDFSTPAAAAPAAAAATAAAVDVGLVSFDSCTPASLLAPSRGAPASLFKLRAIVFGLRFMHHVPGACQQHARLPPLPAVTHGGGGGRCLV